MVPTGVCRLCRHCLAIDSNGRAYAWGSATFGRLGIDVSDTAREISKPRLMSHLASVSDGVRVP